MSDLNRNMLGGWCKIGSKVVSDFYAGESDYIRTVTKVIVYEDSANERVKNSNGFVCTDGGIHPKTAYQGRPLENVSFIDFIKRPNE